MPMRKQYRLHHRDDFNRSRQYGQVTRHPLLILSVLPGAQDYNRYGVVTSKRLGPAVRRNRTRRLMWEAIRQLHPDLKTGHDMVIVVRSAAVGAPLDVVHDALQGVVHRAGLLEKDT
jgi:ribonuclease P protein component